MFPQHIISTRSQTILINTYIITKMNQVFTFNEALEASKIYFDGDELAAKVWVNKYALKDSNGNIYEKTPTDMHWRLAREIARIEKNYPNPMSEEELFELFDRFKYIVPQGGPMTGIGNPYQISSLSNCFVCQLEESNADSYGSIMKVDEELIQLEKRRGGVGHDLSHLRPAMAPVSNAAMSSSGVSSFMERYSNSTREVSQNSRRGALMLSLSINHPDADKFIDAKMEEGKVTGANISVKIDDNFMNAVLEDEVYIQNFPIYSPNPSITKEIKAKELWKKIIHNAWKSAEPGILFWDTIIRESVPDCYSEFGFKTVSTNPCGEIPLCPYDSCRLIALNLYSYVTNPFTDHAGFDIDLLEKHTRLALRIMDDIIDLEIEKIDQIIEKVKSDPESEEVKHTELRLWEKIREKCLMGRRTGVGITAEGDMLAALGYRYGTEASIDFSENIHKIIALNVYKSSVNLARERGVFPVYDSELEKNNPFINRLKEADPEFGEALEKYGRRNIACLTIAPTGTVSLMTQTSSTKSTLEQVSVGLIFLLRLYIAKNRPYEIFTGIADEDNGILLPKSIKNGEIEKYKDEDGNKHYRFSFVNKAGIGGSIDNLENRFSPEFWNYAKLISATLRYEMPIHKVVSLIQSLEWNSESINNWRNGVIRALKGYIQDGTKAKGQKCPNCGQETLIFQEGCLICTSCGSSKCG